MSKCIKYIFSKSCLLKIYFTYIIYIYICQNISDIYLNDVKIYFHGQKLCISHIYFISMRATLIKATTHRRFAKKICGVQGEGTVSKLAVRKRFARFRSGNFYVKDEPHSDQPITEKSDKILEKIEQGGHISSHDVAYELIIHHQTILNHFQKAGFKKKLDDCVPHEFSVKNKMDRLKIPCKNANRMPILDSRLSLNPALVNKSRYSGLSQA